MNPEVGVIFQVARNRIKPKSVRVGRFFGFEEMRIATKGLSKFDS